jgi:hypothetical protein
VVKKAVKSTDSELELTPEARRISALEDEVEKTHREMAFVKKALIDVIHELAEEQDESSIDLVNERVEAILEEASELE